MNLEACCIILIILMSETINCCPNEVIWGIKIHEERIKASGT